MQQEPHIFSKNLTNTEIRQALAPLPAEHYALLVDTQTYAALGKRVFEALGKQATLLHLGDTPKADSKEVNNIIQQVKSFSACNKLISVGSGTLNDLAKYASYQLEIPYIVFPTAPSMNGYASANASITLENGEKTTLPAHAAEAIICDLSVLSSAPKRLIASGLGDSLCRPTAQADWLLSHLLIHTHYDSEPFEMLKPYEDTLFSGDASLSKRDLNAIHLLMRTLLASGEGMQIAGGSYPASQGEHMIAHTLEMMGAGTRQTFHGEEIGITTLYMAALQASLLARPKAPKLKPISFPEETLLQYFNAEQVAAFKQSYAKKQALWNNDLPLLQNRLDASWGEIQKEITALSLPEKQLRQALESVDTPTTPEALGWSREDFDTACTLAAFTRDRFTFLDLAAMLNWQQS